VQFWPTLHQSNAPLQADTLRRVVHALGLNRALVFMNFQQRLKDFQYKLEASKMKVGGWMLPSAATSCHVVCVCASCFYVYVCVCVCMCVCLCECVSMSKTAANYCTATPAQTSFTLLCNKHHTYTHKLHVHTNTTPLLPTYP